MSYPQITSHLGIAKKYPIATIEVVSELAFVFTIYSLVTGLMILHFRAWEPDITRQVLGILTYPTLLFGSVALSWTRVTNKVWISPVCFLLMMVLPFLTILLGKWSLFPLFILGIIATLTAYLHSHPKPFLKTLQLLVIGSILSSLYFFVVNGYGYAHIFADISAYDNSLHRDTLFHSSIIQMLSNFGVSSTGLDGLKEISYHIGVHRWVAANLKTLGGEATLLLGICQQVVFLPAFLFATTLTLSLLVSTELSSLAICGFSLLGLWFLGTCIWDSYLASESYALSLPIFVSMLPVGRAWLLESRQNHHCLTIRPLSIAGSLVAVFACYTAKISSGVMLALFLILCAFAPKIWQRNSISWNNLLGRFSVLSASFGLLCIVLTFTLGWKIIPSPLHFARSYPMQFALQNLVFLWLIILFYFLSVKDDRIYHHSQVFVLALMFLGSQLPGTLLEIGGGGASYFVQPTLLVVFLFTLSTAVDSKIQLFAIVNPTNQLWQPVPIVSWAMIVLVTVLSLNFATPEIGSYASRAKRFVGQLVINLNGFYYHQGQELPLFTGLGKRKHQLGLLLSPPRKSRTQEDTELGSIQSYVSNLNISNNNHSLVAIYISPNFVDFWQPDGARTCWDKSFVIPAVTGFPLLNGVRGENNGCDLVSYYGMANYDSESWNYSMSDADVCARAKKLGFDKVVKINRKSDYKLLTCKSV
jgi:hypothetical protein